MMAASGIPTTVETPGGRLYLPISQFYHVSVDQADPYHVYGGLQDNSVWTGDSQYPGGITNSRWENLLGGTVSGLFADPSDPNYVYAESQGGFVGRVKPRHAGDTLHQAGTQLWGREVAVQLEHTDSFEPQRERDSLYWRAIFIPLARSRPNLGSHFAGL